MNAEVQRLINLLRTAMRILGVTNRDIERKLGLSPSYLSRLYSGGIELKAEHLIEIPQAMGLEPAEFFHLAYPRKTQPSRAAEQLRQVIRELTPAPSPETPSGGFTDEQMQQLREMMRKMLGREAEAKG
jgi:transcriptional regulator with XRE-family HTH domain